LIYDKDVARAGHIAVEHPKAAGKIYMCLTEHFIPWVISSPTMSRPLAESLPFFPCAAPVRLQQASLKIYRYGASKSADYAIAVEKYIGIFAVTSERSNELGFVPNMICCRFGGKRL